MEKRQIAVIAEHINGVLTPGTLETFSFARELENLLDLETKIIIPGKSIRDLTSEIAGMTGMDVIGIEGEDLELYNCEAYLAALGKPLEESDPAYICTPHSAMGYDLSPRLAVRLGASCVTAVEKIWEKGESVTFSRSQWNRKIILEMEPVTEMVVLTVLPGSWPELDRKPEKPGDVKIISAGSEAKNSRTTEIREAERTGFDLAKADVIVSAGKGLGKEENLPLIYKLSEIFPKSAVGASKAACDAGWLDYGHQIGMTGKTVSPKLYIACGISGSTQHIAGMKESQMVVAINTDPAASIFGIADYCIVEDLFTFIPCVIEKYQTFFSLHKESE
ncbi:MAG: electron transfer flavoprotein subunit alpha/FixB family protein [Thermodesulfobacteriota bacterium]|nr:electron transfer flavoprotein subunit alpha/FixB family protein [Thermodesulfobacteriota bacterium]